MTAWGSHDRGNVLAALVPDALKEGAQWTITPEVRRAEDGDEDLRPADLANQRSGGGELLAEIIHGDLLAAARSRGTGRNRLWP
jgi:hypothetical protein